MSNLSMSVKAAPSVISSALNGPSGCLQYDEGTAKLLGQYLTSMESCDTLFDSCMSQLSNDIRYSRGSSVVPSLYLKQLDGPFNAPEIIGGAALTDILY